MAPNPASSWGEELSERTATGIGGAGATTMSFFSGFIPLLQTLDLPLGGVVAGVALGVLTYFAFDYFRRRPTSLRAVTVPVTIVPETTGPREGEAGGGDGAVRRRVRIYDGTSERTVEMTGAGEHPSLPLPRARRFVVVLTLSFVVVAVLLLLGYSSLFGTYDHLVGLVGAFLYWPLAWPGIYAVSVDTLLVPDYIFPMYLAGMAALAFASGLITNRPALPRGRRLAALAIVLVYVALELVIDALFFTVPGATFRDFSLLARAFTGGFFLALLSFCTVFLPTPQQVEPKFPRDRRALRRFFAVGLLALGVATTALLTTTDLLHVHGITLVFTLVLLLPILTLELFAVMARTLYFRGLGRRTLPSVADYHPSVSIIIPAYNEEEWIEPAIAHADRAAAKYPGSVEIVVGNDGSSDRTLELARAALGRLEHAQGHVVDLPHGGKSNALNGALALATGEIVIRCDGDTFISEELGFAALIPHFADPRVGGVQGAIHPRQREGWTRKLRALEIAWNHYLLRPAVMATRSAEVLDGLFSAFRRRDLVDLGGWVPWNGEDTEIAMRIQRYGYEVRMEFGALAFEDVPKDYDTLRRQRVRWARGILMANGQHYASLLGPTPEFTGLGVLFWLLLYVRSGVRSLVYVFLALLIVVLGVPALIDTAILFALAIGLRAGPLGYFLVRMDRADVLPWIPFFPVANVVKQTFRFEALGLLGPRSVQEYV